MTIKDLKDFLRDHPDVDQNGEPYELWVVTGPGLSSPATVGRLNENDVLVRAE